ncbi:MAG: MBL fold metallo-hydrolase [Gemmatimonadota bacterium]|nr:MBL fold metallo-hydrolase [Gemmatimonadota bacterium]
MIRRKRDGQQGDGETPEHHRPGGGFRNPWREYAPDVPQGFFAWARAHRTTYPRPVDPHPSVFRRALPEFPSPREHADVLTITWVGHATFLIQIGGLNILTDPVWSDRLSPMPFAGPRRWVPPGVELESLPPIDIVLVSHNHYDHFDTRSVKRLATLHPGAHWFTPLELGAHVQREGARLVQELDWWSQARVGPVTVTCTPAQHWSARGLRDRGSSLWCGYALRTESRAIYFAGDTAYFPGFREIAERLGPLDIALLPIGGYEPRWFMKFVHMNPEDAVRAFTELSGTGEKTKMVPMHWGTFKLTDEAMDEPPRRLLAAWQEAKLSDDRLWIPAHGESRSIPPSSQADDIAGPSAIRSQ